MRGDRGAVGSKVYTQLPSSAVLVSGLHADEASGKQIRNSSTVLAELAWDAEKDSTASR